MHFLDILFLVYAGLAAAWGSYRRLSGQLVRLVRKGVALALGLGLYPLIVRLLDAFLPSFLAHSGGILLAFALPFMVARRLRPAIHASVERRLGAEMNRRWGALAGALSAAVNVVALLAVLTASPGSLSTRFLTSRSALARATAAVMHRLAPGENAE